MPLKRRAGKEKEASPTLPHKAGPSVFTSRTATYVEEVAAAVDRDMKSMLYTVDTRAFIERMFPHNPSSTQKILRKLKTYRKKNHWVGFPKKRPTGKEKTLYQPFSQIANQITEEIPHGEVSTKIVWLDRSSKSPASLEKDMPKGRPDCAGAVPDDAMEQLDAKIRELKRGKRRRASGKNKGQKEELMLQYTLWWMRIHAPGEIKPGRSEWEEGVKQVMTYMRQMLTEQLDRRFVLGFVLCFDELWLVLLDRSGMIMTKTPINIHKDPETFIRIISGFARMEPDQLGWDTSMKIYRPVSDEIRASYEVGPEFEGTFGDGRYHVHWVIDVFENGQKVKYLTVSIISALRSAEVCGRATVVYEVVKFNERYKPTETRALKRYWRPIVTENSEDHPSEGEIYETLDKNKLDDAKYMFSYHDVKVNGHVDSTLKLIRQGLVGEQYKRPTKPLRTLPRRETDADAEPRLRRNYLPRDYAMLVEPSTLAVVDRHLANILLRMGEVITTASSRKELLKCFLNSIEDHEYSYYQGYIHRDISNGNILIFTAANESFGRLIDYDHAKKSKGFSSMIVAHSDEDFQEGMHSVRFLLRTERAKVEDDVIRKALELVGNETQAANYVKASIKMKKPGSGSVGLSDLGWEHKVIKTDWPDFVNRTHRQGERTGTLSYMSAEVIARTSVYPRHDGSFLPFTHEAIHDLESFLWVLVHICITRQGPGINMSRKDEFDPNNEAFDEALCDALVRYFEGSENILKEAKMTLLKEPEFFEEKIVNHFHPYYEPLKPLIQQWWNILNLGYRYRGDEFYYIHKHIIRILQDAIKTLSDESSNWDTRKELTRREEHRKDVLQTFMFSKGRNPGRTPSSSLSSLTTTQDSPSPTQRPPKKKKRI